MTDNLVEKCLKDIEKIMAVLDTRFGTNLERFEMVAESAIQHVIPIIRKAVAGEIFGDIEENFNLAYPNGEALATLKRKYLGITSGKGGEDDSMNSEDLEKKAQAKLTNANLYSSEFTALQSIAYFLWAILVEIRKLNKEV